MCVGGHYGDKGREKPSVMICEGEISLLSLTHSHTHANRVSHRQVRGLMRCCNSGKSMLLKHLAMTGNEIQSE